ncbi:MAG: YncE family protein [Gemmatimonadaceae bacterium]|nr:YncE family protein [Gemmatimonadaceae bacterium]
MDRARRIPLTWAVALVASLATAGRAQVPGLTGTLVVTNKSPSTATIIDVASGRTLATLPTGPGPHEIALSTDGATAVVTDYSGPVGTRKTLSVIDVPGRRVVRTIDLGDYRSPHGIRFLPGDSLVAVTSEASRNVVIVSVSAGAVRRAIPTNFAGSHMIGITADGARGYTGNIGGNSVSEFDLKSWTFVRSFEVPAQPEAINVTPDGAEVWVGSNATGRVSVLELSTGTLTSAAEGVSWPYRVLFTPDVKTVVIPDLRNHEVRFIERVTRREISRLALPGAGPQGITITPDARYVFLSLSTQARVAIIDMKTRAVVGYVPAGDTPDGVVYTTTVSR